MLRLFNAVGKQQSVTYDGSGRLATVTDPNGRVLSFSYNTDDLLSTLQTPDGNEIGFTYTTSHDLSTVTYPGGSTRQYLYDESTYSAGSTVGLLTGEIDELNVRYSTTWYDSSLRATATSLAGAVDSFAISYLAPDATGDYTRSSVTQPLGATQETKYVLVAGVVRPRVVTTTCTGCQTREQTYT